MLELLIAAGVPQDEINKFIEDKARAIAHEVKLRERARRKRQTAWAWGIFSIYMAILVTYITYVFLH